MIGEPPLLDQLATAGLASTPVGAKARNLGRLIAAGLPVPPGFAIAADQSCDEPRLVERARQLGPRLAVRSSALVEDRPGASAAGLFASRLDVSPADLASACQAVRASAASPAVKLYLDRVAGAAEPVGMAVIVQRMVGRAGGLRGVVYTRPIDPDRRDADEITVEARLGDELVLATSSRQAPERFDREPARPWLRDEQLSTIVALALRAESAIDADRGADIEWCIDEEGTVWLVQARPLPARRQAITGQLDPASMAFSRSEPGRTWHWDAAHNPDPLSPAQAGLVELVGDLAPVEMRVIDGYLYWSAKPDSPAEPELDPDQLRDRFADCANRMEEALAPAEAGPPVSIAAALATYREVYAIYAGELGPALAPARRRYRTEGGSAKPASAVARAVRLGDGRSVAALASAWDVAAPPVKPPASAGPEPAPALGDEPLSIPAMIELDDLYFFRAQALVRRALLAAGSRLGLPDPDDIFYVPLEDVRLSDESAPRDAHALTRRAGAARQLREQQREITPPLAFRNGRPVPVPHSRLAPGVWRGLAAAPGTARGPALRITDLGRLPQRPQGQVIVCASLTPATLIQISGASAIVCEHGGVLDHAAAIARELAIPAVVGLPQLMNAVTDGDELVVDGHAGMVIALPPARAARR